MTKRVFLLSLAFLLAATVACAANEAAPTEPPSSSPTPISTPTASITPTPSPPGGTATPGGIPSQIVLFGQPAVMHPGDEATIESGWLLRFIGVTNDSRCPVDVQCVWAGEATVQLAVVESDATTSVEITMPGGSSASAVFGAFTIEASALFPAPRSTSPIAPGDYEVTLVVRPTTVAASGIDGLVTIGPQCPVVRIDQPCPDRTYEASIVIRDSSGREVGRVRSGVDGRFAIDLPPGRYHLEPEAGQPLPIAGPVDVEVPSGGRAFAAIQYDSGIR